MKKHKFLKIAALLMVALMGLLCLAPQAEAQVTPVNFGTLTNLPTLMTNINATAGAATTSNTTCIIEVQQGKSLNLWTYFAMGGACASNLLMNIQATPDGTNYTTTTPHQLKVLMNGTTAVLGWTNIPATALEGCRYLKISSIVNQSTNQNVFFTNSWYSWRY